MSAIAVTGSTGYVGRKIVDALSRACHEVVVVGRTPIPGMRHVPFSLEQPEPVDLSGVDAVIHAAYDFSAVGRPGQERNSTGAENILGSAVRHGARPVLVSSLSAWDGSRSRYGRDKLASERAFIAAGGAAVRAGVVFGPGAGGIFGSLLSNVTAAPRVPLVGGRDKLLYMTHDRVLAESLVATAMGEGAAPLALAAHPEPMTMQELVEALAEGRDRAVRTISVPWMPVYAALKVAEAARVPVPFRSDSVLSIAYPVPVDQVARLPLAPGGFPALRQELWLGTS
jgi:nucleoside-diphosphate-sugar epimerase